jgi:glycosyltransferase involved in cell wall biosynthesis
VAPEKGLDRLAGAYRRLRHDGRLPASRLEAAGYLGGEHRDYLAGIERRLREWGLAEEFVYHGELDRAGKLAFLARLDVFSVPAPYHEAKGLSVLEAMATGVPVVLPRSGAFIELIGRTNGGLLVEPDDEESLAEGLRRIWSDRELGSSLGRQGAEGVRTSHTVGTMADRAIEVYRELAGRSVTAGGVAVSA